MLYQLKDAKTKAMCLDIIFWNTNSMNMYISPTCNLVIAAQIICRQTVNVITKGLLYGAILRNPNWPLNWVEGNIDICV